MYKEYGKSINNPNIAVVVETTPSGYVKSPKTKFSDKSLAVSIVEIDFLDTYIKSCLDSVTHVMLFRDWKEALGFYNDVAAEPLVGVAFDLLEDFIGFIKTVAPRRSLKTTAVMSGDDKPYDTQKVVLAGALSMFFTHEVEFDESIQEELYKLVPTKVKEYFSFIRLSNIYAKCGSLKYFISYLKDHSLFELLSSKQFLNCTVHNATHCFEIYIRNNKLFITNGEKSSYKLTPDGLRFYYNAKDPQGASVYANLISASSKIKSHVSRSDLIKELEIGEFDLYWWLDQSKYPIRELLLLVGKVIKDSNVAVANGLLNIYQLCEVLSDTESFEWDSNYSTVQERLLSKYFFNGSLLPELYSINRRINSIGETSDDFNINDVKVAVSETVFNQMQYQTDYYKFLLYHILEQAMN